jgi:hypothetical protein
MAPSEDRSDTTDVAEARYPKKVRDLAKLEAGAVELGAYGCTVVHGLLETEEYAVAHFNQRQPSGCQAAGPRISSACRRGAAPGRAQSNMPGSYAPAGWRTMTFMRLKALITAIMPTRAASSCSS